MDTKDYKMADQSSSNRGIKGRFAFLLWFRRLIAQNSTRQRVLLVISFLLMVAILQIDLVPKTLDVQLGEPSAQDIRAPRTVINTVRTKERQDEAISKAVEEALNKREFMTISTSAGSEANSLLTEVFIILDERRDNLKPESTDKKLTEQLSEAQRRLSEARKDLNISPESLKKLLTMNEEEYERIKKSLRQIFLAIQTEVKIDEKNRRELEKELDDSIQLYPLLPEDAELVKTLIGAMAFPNLVPDQAKLRQLQEETKKKVTPVTVERGRLVIREGDIITSEDIQLLRDLSLIDNRGNRILIFISLALFTLFLMVIGLLYVYYFDKNLLKQERHLYLIALVILVVLALGKGISLLDLPWLNYLIPLSFAAIIMTFLIDPQVSVIMTTLLSLMLAVIVNFNLSLAIFYFVSGVSSIYCMLRVTQRKELNRRGLIMAGINFMVALTLGLLFNGGSNFLSLLSLAVTGGFNGILSTALAIGFLPFLEHLFGLTSALSLLELSNPNLPLLKRLLIEAPGTYHHSIIVGNLAEAAADAIGADSLLVRVGSYYHDIGKLKRPYFFIENQIAQDNPHEKLSPNLSTLIITSHVRDGVELARSYGVPEVVRDLIEQHHGTDLVRYFFQRASENLQEDKEKLEEDEFRYPGPRPQSKEAALVMLADSVEATARAMGTPSPARLEAMVTATLKNRLEAGELDEANLTFKDLDKIKNAFLKVLGGIFHHRIKYPELGIEMEKMK